MVCGSPSIFTTGTRYGYLAKVREYDEYQDTYYYIRVPVAIYKLLTPLESEMGIDMERGADRSDSSPVVWVSSSDNGPSIPLKGDSMEPVPCDFEDCESEEAQHLMIVKGGDPIGVLCDEHHALVTEKTEDGSHKLSVDIHFHKHTTISLVTPEQELPQVQASYAEGIIQ